MSPVRTATKEKDGRRPDGALPFAFQDLPQEAAREIVVDWQMPADTEHKRVAAPSG